MAGANWRPDLWFGVALNAEPNDANTSPVWSDYTDDFMKAENYDRGRDFELDQGMSSAPKLEIRDVNEDFNPENPGSPHVNLIQPYRPACLLAQWPRQADITGGAVNLFNTSAWRGNKVDPMDGSFESFAAGGSKPNWAGTVGTAANFVIDTGSPFQGGKDLAWTVAATTGQQGVSWPVACIPGRQYTASAYVRQTTASTQRISVSDQVVGSDPFNTTNANGWGTDRTGRAWAPLAGAAALFSTSNLAATIAADLASNDRSIVIDTGALDHTLTLRLIAPDPATVGATSVTSGAVVRVTDSSNHIDPLVIWRADGTVGLATFKRVAGVRSTVVAEVATGWQYSAGQEFVLLVSTLTLGTTVNVNSMVWPIVKPQPVNYHNTGTATDAVLLGGTKAGFSVRVESTSGVTFPYPVRAAVFNAVGYVHGSTTAATGAYNRVSVTFTATQPQHRVQLATTGTAAAGTVFLDALQHEQGAAASAYTTSGPGIYPVFRNSLERFPRSYSSAGFEAFVSPPCVDAMAALSAIVIETEYAQAVLDSGPDFFWRLNDGTETQLFADTSGNGGPPLGFVVSKFGAGTAPEPGVAMGITGDPDGTGVTFAPGNTVSDTSQGTILGVGRAGGGIDAGITIPTTGSRPWAATMSCWMRPASRVPFDADPLRITGRQRSFILRVGTTSVQGFFAIPGVAPSGLAEVVGNIWDGGLHHLVLSVAQDAVNTTLTLWVDGVSNTGSFATSLIGGITTSVLDSVQVGGAISEYSHLAQSPVDGDISDCAVWSRALSNTEVQALYTAGSTAFNGETTGARILRRLSAPGRYNGPLRISQQGVSPDALQTPLQPASWSGQKDLLSDSQETSTAEQGTFWCAPDGAIVFEDRGDRWLRLAADLVFGEDTASGEIPYLMDGLEFDFDSMYVFANVQVGRNNGVTATGGTIGDIAKARRRYFPRAAGGSFDFYNDSLPQSMAHWIFYSHNQPMVRVAALEIDPVANPLLWPVVLQLEIGRRVTFKRRSKAANNGAGITMSDDYFVEKISIPAIDNEACVWRYKVQLSPINAGGSAQGQPTMQPWILGNAAYGQLGLTTVLGW